MRFWLGCQVWFNSRRPFRDGLAMSTRDEMKPPVIKAMHILFTVVLLSWNSPLLAPLSGKTVWALCVSVCVWQGYAGTEESLGNSVLLLSDMSDVARDNVIPSTTKLKAALRLLFSKQPAWVRPLGLCFVNVCISECLCLFRCCNPIVSVMCEVPLCKFFLSLMLMAQTPTCLNIVLNNTCDGHITSVWCCQVMHSSSHLSALWGLCKTAIQSQSMNINRGRN